MRILLLESVDAMAEILQEALDEIVADEHWIQIVKGDGMALYKLRNEMPLPDLVIASFAEESLQTRFIRFYERLKAEFPQIPVMLLTQFQEAELKGENDVAITLPYDRPKLAEALQTIFPNTTFRG